MESVIFEISLCLIENIIIFVFLSSLLKSRFNTIIPVMLAIAASAISNYFCSTMPIVFKISIAVFWLILCVLGLYQDKPVVKISYAFISIYILSITDIILGNIISLIMSQDIQMLFFSNLTYRFIFSLIVKVADVLVFYAFYKMLDKIDKNIKSKFWVLFAIVMFVFLSITTVFLQIYPDTEQNSASTVMYTALTSLFFAMSVILIYFYTEISKSYQRDSKLFLLENNFNTLQEQIAVQQQNNEKVRKLRHDMKNHLANIRSLIDRGEISDAVTLLDKTAENVNNAKAEMIDTGNSFVDAIILSKTAVCREKNIDFTYSVQPLAKINVDIVDLSSLLSNLLDNAIESAVQTSEPFIKLIIFKYNAYYTICVENSYKGKIFLKENSGTLITTKSSKALHGYGTQIISDIALKYDGSYSWEAQDNKFVSTVLIKI